MSARSAKRKLKQNAEIIDQKADPVMWNLNAALIDLCDGIDSLSRDMDVIFRRLDLIRNAQALDQDDLAWPRRDD